MFQAIEKLNKEKEKLATEFKQSKTEYKSEIRRINTAIRHFSQGFEALVSNPSKTTFKRGMVAEVEDILKNGAMHLKKIVVELKARGFSSVKSQSVSAVLQIQVKAGRKFIKVAPATFALIHIEKQKVDLDLTGSNEFFPDDTFEF